MKSFSGGFCETCDLVYASVHPIENLPCPKCGSVVPHSIKLLTARKIAGTTLA